MADLPYPLLVHKYAKESSNSKKLFSTDSLTESFAADLGLAKCQ